MNVLKSYFVFGGVSSLDFGLRVEEPRIAKKPKRRVTKVTIPGSSRDFFYQEEGFDNVEIAYKTWCLEEERDLVLSRVGEISRWLTGEKYLVLSDTYDPEHFRLAQCCEPLDPEILLRRAAKQDIVFSCDPFRYLWEGQEKLKIAAQEGDITGTRKLELFNTGWKTCPLIQVNGSGTVTVTVYSEETKTWEGVFSLSGSLEIDSDAMETRLNGSQANHLKTAAGYPTLESGWCRVEISRESGGAVSSAFLTPRWRTL